MPDALLAPETPDDDAEPFTRREIAQQPETLRATQALLRANKAAIEAFVAPLLARPDLRVVLTGAGTSAFIGECLAPWLSRELGRTVEAIATTDIVSGPTLHLRRDAPTLLVSFGRSGSSPESIAAADLVDAHVDEAFHLIVTCNAEGALGQRQGDNIHVVVLPEATHDRGFAMTSSFSAMMLAALSILSGIDRLDGRVEAIAAAVQAMVAHAEPLVADLAGRGFRRVVYLGSGVFKGLAREAALKLMELSDGAVVTAFDTALGFRHGPKTIINAETLAVVFVSNDPLTRLYDLDIVQELRSDGHSGAVVMVSAQPGDDAEVAIAGMAGAGDADLLFPFIVPAQLFGLHVSLALGLTPDRPNASGTVNRVVQGVRIHAPGT
ncbi:tagatose-6-phosphate ketose/aldose isomerase [Sphingopyxis panaciterrae]|uniref:SIS domain-containing protein n=1 Tax=Sphingopyxis panaciterrae TaxID=363841 RepID=UPI0014249625|nr:SIS domain-containing protein [Sphingopyxis panaciterrae]NIJ35535.1 tagatose-6-phosphate ketose/aldose isomerase [Sphingopyxis panaciterrae]